ncbi:MAG: acetyl-CoA carboxylase biotin carboxyl carrier protein [Candidatus Paceibacteria bacterium]|jgi:acetyl-CoA carboxylase biotin carboxyl carrier protein
MDPKLIRRLARIMSGEGLTELKIADKETGLELCLKRGTLAEPGLAPQVLQMMPGAMSSVPGASAAPAAPGGAAEEGGLPPGATVIESPMVGTFYRAAGPDSDPFVDVGARIDDEKVVCIVEAMKVMNEIKAEVRGSILEILVSDGDPVEFGQPLFLIKKD